MSIFVMSISDPLNACKGIFRDKREPRWCFVCADASSAETSAIAPLSGKPSVLPLVLDNDADSLLTGCSGLGDPLLALLLALAVESCALKLFATWGSGVFAAAGGRFLMNGAASIAPG